MFIVERMLMKFDFMSFETVSSLTDTTNKAGRTYIVVQDVVTCCSSDFHYHNLKITKNIGEIHIFVSS
jgi:hypothetical protein